MTLFTDPFMQWGAVVVFALALMHTLSANRLHGLAAHYPKHAGVWHLLGEVEVVFGFWALMLVLLILGRHGQSAAIQYLESRQYVEPLFVFVIMVIAGTKPVLYFARRLVLSLAQCLPMRLSTGMYLVTLAIVPLVGSLITEPAAMTVAALILRSTVFTQKRSERFKYVSLAVLFVNISVGGTLSHFAAPPVLMVASKWAWDLPFMFNTFGWKAIVVVCINAAAATIFFRHELASSKHEYGNEGEPVPLIVGLIHLLFLVAVVVCAHHAVIFMALLLFFLGFVSAYPKHQHALIFREALLVAFFLAGLVVLGGMQQWWLQPLLSNMESRTVFYAALMLTAVTDNAALTYLGSLVTGLSADFKVALVGGAVAGGGLTVIANAPNPAGVAILKDRFTGNAVSVGGLLLAAIPPTVVAALIFQLL
ncbi:MAG: hypothetical protein RLZZ502_469 [Pseudomonadota bacterium]